MRWISRSGWVRSGQVRSRQVRSSRKGLLYVDNQKWAHRPMMTARLGPTANKVRHKAQKTGWQAVTYCSIMLLLNPKLTKMTRGSMNTIHEPMIRTSHDPLQLVSAHIHIHCASAHCLHYSFVIHCPLSPPYSIISLL